MPDKKIDLAVLDMAGTTVADSGLVLRAFEAAATEAGIEPEGPHRDRARRYVLDTMGQSKIAVFRALLGDEDRAQLANRAFENTYDRLIDEVRIAPIPGAAEAISALRSVGVRVALTTGFSRATQDRLLAALGWTDLADLARSELQQPDHRRRSGLSWMGECPAAVAVRVGAVTRGPACVAERLRHCVL